MKRLLLGVFTLACSVMYSQTFTSSNLPIVIINTDGGADIVDDPRVGATMKIIYRTDGLRNNVTDQDSTLLLNYNGRIDIEVRGSSSQFLPKKGYGLTTRKLDGSNNNVSLLGMPAENDWILNGLAFDSSLMRDFLSYELARRVGNYAPRTVYCELMINGAHYGLYLLQEKIKLNSNRVDIAKMEAADTSLPKLTGGYITKVDKPNADTPAWSWSSNTGINDVVFLHEYPKAEDIHEAQHNYIKGTFEQLATAAAAHNSSKINGYPSVIDIPSFVDFMIMNELSSNADGYHFSSYFHKERQGKLRAGPIWDFNLTFGNDLVRWLMDRSKTNVWQFDNGDNEGPK
ncbi:MAG TPA: CotH kinase family protein, partial [Cytophagales bacterium]|nr:CotH kinase family protein [Cytophagales bacterium]